MINFESLLNSPEEKPTYDLEKFYNSLDVKSSHIAPRPEQKEAMAELTKRYEERDLVLKLNTGAGKTTVGLLYLYGHMKTSGEPVVYLCPTTQLMSQVQKEAGRLGIPAKLYPGGETYPDPECSRGKAIIICTYEKLFNAKSTFARADVNIVPAAIVLDDAHAGVESIRKQFTLKVTGQAYEELKDHLSSSCKAYNKTKWMDIENEDPAAVLEVPHWVWAGATEDLQTTLHRYSGEKEFMFVWPYLKDMLPLCRCVFSSGYAEIAPEVLPTEYVAAFEKAKHRLFMSATLADDSLLTRELGASIEGTKLPVLPPSDRGQGERMILSPSLIDPSLDREYVMGLCNLLSSRYKVVVLTSSAEKAKQWSAEGAHYYSGDDFDEGVEALRSPSSGVNFAVFAQRYDGVDLPDDSCRILVIDGTPQGESLIDKADSQLSLTPGGVRNKTIFRIEQGMGRAVRSNADFAVVLLVGDDINTYIGRKDVLAAVTADTRNQLELSNELAELAKKSASGEPSKAVTQLIGQCLSRDDGWKKYYNQRVRAVSGSSVTIDESKIQLASEERESHKLALSNRSIDAKDRYQRAINAAGLTGDELGMYLQRLARITYLADPAEGIKIQSSARKHSIHVSIPPAASNKPLAPGSKSVAERFCNWYRSFTPSNAAVLDAKRIADKLDLSASHKQVEAALKDLGIALGAASHRPDDEFNEGPDNLWFWGDKAFVIEAKNQNEESLHKSNSGQLHDSLEWAKTNYPSYADRLQPLIVANVTKADDDANFPAGTKVLTQDSLTQLATGLHLMCQKLAKEGPLFVTPENVMSEMASFKLLPEQLLGQHAKNLT